MEKTLRATKDLWPPMKYGEIRPNSEWITQRDTSHTPNYLKHFDKVYYFEYLKASKTVYVRHSRIQDDKKESVVDFYNLVFEFIDNNEVDKLVLDVRLNGGRK